MSPKPILKRSLSTEQHTQQYIHHHHRHIHHPHSTHGVHFPPSPSLTRTFSAYSSSTYDRSPIVVSPNTCALPERGCPGRTYLLDEQASPSPRARGLAYARDYHPRALAFASSSNANYSQMPQLVPDLSSESEESDGFYSMPADHTPSSSTPQQTFGIHGLAGPNGNGMSSAKYNNNNNNIAINTDDGYTDGYAPCDDDPLAFLPYGPSSPPNYYPSSPMSPSSVHFVPEDADDMAQIHKSRRKRSDRRHESSTDPDRIPRGSAGGDLSLGMGSLSISPSPFSPVKSSGSPTRKKGVRRAVPMQLPPSLGGFCVSDDGCLGGF
ncbi:hypothetical protein CVT25_015364 [Psilocybe cyanescens]|uniref:Uncharacterized protein n=1 Tax=Psilocybe cyanescens TaxID=93625 RepID=A0A409WH99_PSICY|nr:hypothetical protein CVT25_015364 [Psilocybe cyanescens]